MKLAALIFDVDGTLVDTEELHRRAFNEAFRQLALGWDWGLCLYAELLKVSGGAERIAAYIDRLPDPAGEKTRLRRLAALIHREKTRIYGELLGGGARMRQGVGRLIAEASACGIRIGFLATSASANVSALLAAAFGGAGAAPAAALVCADQVARKKPAPDIYELLLATLRAPAEACVAFEDSQNGVAAAKAAGLYTIATPSRWTLAQDFSAADLLLPTLGEPDKPLDPGIAARIGGAPCLGLAQLEALRARAALREAGA